MSSQIHAHTHTFQRLAASFTLTSCLVVSVSHRTRQRVLPRYDSDYGSLHNVTTGGVDAPFSAKSSSTQKLTEKNVPLTGRALKRY